ncbi:MAG: hypothetical protein JW852_08855 [Spirochaetales bacterium]|nr:hypothetical protein [Spirochaetales bacterium]
MDQYEFSVKGHISDYWESAFEGFKISRLPNGRTRISGNVIDQAHLFKVLTRIRDTGLVLIEVKKLQVENM